VVHNWVANVFSDEGEVETEVRKCLRRQSKDVYAAAFDALVKRRDKCISVGGGYVEK
jgi:nitrate reductase assembly molybdenum cofactor insertion protein NarJ